MEHTEAEILEGNKLLAEFMDWTKSPIHGWLPKDKEDRWNYGDDDTLLFHESWDWMFPAIDKINGLGKAYSFATFKTYVSLTVEKSGNKMYKDFSFAHAEYITAEQTGKEAAFKLLVKFIKWHNEHVKQLETV